MRGEPEGVTSESPPQDGRPAPGGTTHPGGLLLSAALLGSTAILIAESRLGLLDLHDVVRYSQADLDLDNVVSNVAGWLGVALAVSGVLGLVGIWAASRFRVSIGRLMVVVAMLAIFLQVFVALRQGEQARPTSRAVPAPSASRR